jgi:hypothetical protein
VSLRISHCIGFRSKAARSYVSATVPPDISVPPFSIHADLPSGYRWTITFGGPADGTVTRLVSSMAVCHPLNNDAPVSTGTFWLIARLKVYSALGWLQAQMWRYRASMIRDTVYKTYLISAGAVTVAWTGLFIWIVAGAFGF